MTFTVAWPGQTPTLLCPNATTFLSKCGLSNFQNQCTSSFNILLTVETVADFIFGGAPKSLQMVTAAMKLKDAYSLEEKLWPT